MTITFARRQLLTASALQEAFDEVVAQLNVQLDLFDTDTVTAAQISDASANGRSLVTAANYAAMKTLLAIAQSDVSGLSATLALKAALASPAFTGTPTAPTATSGTSTTQLATTAFVQGAVAPVVRSASQLLAGQEGIAFDFLSRTAVINDYSNTLSSAGRPSDLLTVTRASTKMCVNRSKLLASVAINTLAYDHDPLTGVPNGILSEPAATNLLLRSEEFANASWTKTRSSISANTIASPDGATTADTFVEDATAANSHFVQQTISGTTNTNPYTFSVWVKASTRTNIRIRLAEAVLFAQAVLSDFNLTTGVITRTTISGTAVAGTSTITAYANGWYRCSITATLGGVQTGIIAQLFLNDGTDSYNYTGDGTSGLYLWGAQLETGSVATSYIPTTSGTVTRSADAVSIAASLFPLNAAQGTLFVDALIAGRCSADYPHLVSLSGVSENTDSICLPWSPAASGAVGGAIRTGNVAQSGEYVGSVKSVGSFVKTAMGYASNDVMVVTDGTLGTSDTSATIPTVTRMLIGQPGIYQLQAAFNIRRAAYISRRMTNAELQAMTA